MMMSNAYSYDAVDNILGMENSISPQSNKGMNPSKLVVHSPIPIVMTNSTVW